MTAPGKILAFLAAVAAVFGAALGIGKAVGPVTETAAPAQETHHPSASPGEDTPPTEAADEIPGGLMLSQDGYSLRLADPSVGAGQNVPVAFTIDGPDDEPVTAYDVEHEKKLHLIAVRRDFTGFQHVHPELDADGVWTTGLDLTPGPWRLFADFKATAGPPLTLGVDLSVPGDYQPTPSAGDVRTAQVDGYTVTLDGALTPGSDAKLSLSVSKDGQPVTDLDPYLGAYGHLVALREGDLAYLHVHPDGEPGDGATQPGPGITFYAAVPSTGSYRLFLDFQHQGVVRTAAFAISTTGEGEAPPTGGHSPDSGHNSH